MADSRFPEGVLELAREEADILNSLFMDPNSSPTPTEMDRLGHLEFEIRKFAIDQYGLTGNDLETYLDELMEFARLEVENQSVETLKYVGIEKRMVPKDGESCSICLQNLNVGDEALLLKCSHTFHEKCMSEWLRRKPSCPLCRYDVRMALF